VARCRYARDEAPRLQAPRGVYFTRRYAECRAILYARHADNSAAACRGYAAMSMPFESAILRHIDTMLAQLRLLRHCRATFADYDFS